MRGVRCAGPARRGSVVSALRRAQAVRRAWRRVALTVVPVVFEVSVSRRPPSRGEEAVEAAAQPMPACDHAGRSPAVQCVALPPSHLAATRVVAESVQLLQRVQRVQLSSHGSASLSPSLPVASRGAIPSATRGWRRRPAGPGPREAGRHRYPGLMAELAWS